MSTWVNEGVGYSKWHFKRSVLFMITEHVNLELVYRLTHVPKSRYFHSEFFVWMFSWIRAPRAVHCSSNCNTIHKEFSLQHNSIHLICHIVVYHVFKVGDARWLCLQWFCERVGYAHDHLWYAAVFSVSSSLNACHLYFYFSVTPI